MVVCAVHDSGPGLDRTLRDRVFEPFFSTKPSSKGTGMGLAMVHGIVHRHGGHVVLDSPDEGGLSVRLLFPALSSCEPHTDTDPEADDEAGLPEHTAANVLVVDDEAAIATFLRELFEMNGFTVKSFTSSAAVLEHCRGEPAWPDLLVTDQTMPGMTGSELIDRVRQEPPDLPVILCTGHSDVLTDEGVRAWGRCVLFRKPTRIGPLIATARALLCTADPST